MLIGPDKVSIWPYSSKQAFILVIPQRPVFFAVRIFLGVISTFCEVKFYRTVFEKINERVGRYLFFMLLTSAGMWNSSTGNNARIRFESEI
jgi:hypothetical protein